MNIELIKKLEERRDFHLAKVSAYAEVIADMCEAEVDKDLTPLLRTAEKNGAPVSQELRSDPPPKVGRPAGKPGPDPKYDYEEMVQKLKTIRGTFSHQDLMRVCGLAKEPAHTVMQQLLQNRYVKKVSWGRYVVAAELYTLEEKAATSTVVTPAKPEEEEEAPPAPPLKKESARPLGLQPEQTPIAMVSSIPELEARLEMATRHLTAAQIGNETTRCTILTDKIRIINERIEELKKKGFGA